MSLFEGRKVYVYRKVDVDAVLSEKDARIRKLMDDVQKQNLELQHCYNRINRLSVMNCVYEQCERDYLECINATALEVAALKAQLEPEPARSPVDCENASVLTDALTESERLRERERWLYRASRARHAKWADYCIEMVNKYSD